MQKEEMRNFLVMEAKDNNKSELESYRALMKVFGIADVIETLQNVEKERKEHAEEA